jgi:hypothetical protein
MGLAISGSPNRLVAQRFYIERAHGSWPHGGYSDEKSVIEAKVKAVVDVFANNAAEIIATIENALPAAASAASVLRSRF